MIKTVFTEILVWILSIVIAIIIWYPIWSQIPFMHLPLVMIQTVMIIQIFRWFVFYDRVWIFRSTWNRMVMILFLFGIGAVTLSKGLEVIRIIENQDLLDISQPSIVLSQYSLSEVYQILSYLRTLLTFTTIILPAACLMMILKIIYRSVGYGSHRVKKYLETSTQDYSATN